MKSPTIDAQKDKTTQPQGQFHYYFNNEWRGSALTFSPNYLEALTEIMRELNQNSIPRPFYIEWHTPRNTMIYKTIDWAEAYKLIHWCEQTNTNYDFRNEKDTIATNTNPEIGITTEQWEGFYLDQTERTNLDAIDRGDSILLKDLIHELEQR